jgi:signal transduction histidine kinase
MNFMNPVREPLLKRLLALLEIPATDAARARRRLELMERNVMLPVKAAFIGMILYSFQHSSWIGHVSNLLDVTVETVQDIVGVYVLFNVALAVPMLFVRRLPLAVGQWAAVTSSLIDGLVVAGMMIITGGLDSILFWFLLGLIVRNAVSVPPGFSQLFLNFAISLCYVLVAVLDTSIFANLDAATLQTLDLWPHEELGEPFVLRLLVLWLAAISCHGAQAFLEVQRAAAEEAGEFAARESQLRSAGRLAAEFAHQIKNPLAIINNATFSLRRALGGAGGNTATQIEIIQEEVARADRVITQIMGYAQLSEGHVEKLDVAEKLDQVVAQVFPEALSGGVRVERQIAAHLPPLLMQRGHLAEILVNLLQNAREALNGHGRVVVAADRRPDHAVVISVSDNGPGIPSDKLARIFEAYFTTKDKGTGLGLAIVKHNAELYGGSVSVESELGQGAKFTVTFPAKASPTPFAK